MNLVSMYLILIHSECDSNSHNHNIPCSNHNNRYSLLPPTCFTKQFITFYPHTESTASPTPSILIIVSITSLGISTAGEVFSLQCSTMSSGSTNQLAPTITWLDSSLQLITSTGDGTKAVSTTMMNPDGGYFSTLSFDPLLASDAGLYVCRVMVGSVIRVETVTINVSGMLYCDLRDLSCSESCSNPHYRTCNSDQ